MIPRRADPWLALLFGAMMPLAFKPLAWWPIVLLSPAVLLLLIQRADNFKAIFWRGWLFGLGYLGFGIYWIYNSLHDYGQAPPPVAGFITVSLVMFLSLYVAAMFASAEWFRRKRGYSLIWLLPLAGFSFEWFKGVIFTGFPWLSIGYAHTESLLAGFAPIIGIYGITALSLVLSVALFHLLKTRQPVWMIALILVPAAGYGLGKIEWSESLDQTLSVSIIQGNIPQEMKWDRSKRNEILSTYWVETGQHWDKDLIVWPETAIPGRTGLIEQNVLLPMAHAAAEQESNLLVGVIYSELDSKHHYNSMLLLGEHQGVYHKRHLVPFGEYYPYRFILEHFRRWIRIPYSDLSAGDANQLLMSIKDIQLGVSICYEDVFSRDILLDLPEANLLVNSSNDAWFGDSWAAPQHLQIAQMRSLETARPMVRATNTGISAFIDHQGRIAGETQMFAAQVLSHEVVPRQGETPFLLFAKLQPWLASVIMIGLAIGAIRVRRKKPHASQVTPG